MSAQEMLPAITSTSTGAVRPLRMLHVVYSFSIGGLENVIVPLINRLPVDRFEHVVMSLITISDFKDRVKVPPVRSIELHRQPGHAFLLCSRIFRPLRDIKPDVVHTCNLATLEIVPLVWLVGVPQRIRTGHAWDAHGPCGASVRYQRIRRFYRPFVSHYVAVSEDIYQYLGDRIHSPASLRSLISNGVDTDHFPPKQETSASVSRSPFQPGHRRLVGTVGRLQTVKNQSLLARAFVRLVSHHPQAAQRLRLVIVGEGPLRADIDATLKKAGMSHLAWLPGARDDVPDVLRLLNCFVLPSTAESTSCTLQESMATGLPVASTAVGGMQQLVTRGLTGLLVSPVDKPGLADVIHALFAQPETCQSMGHHARDTARQRFGLSGMVARYSQIFEQRHPVRTTSPEFKT